MPWPILAAAAPYLGAAISAAGGMMANRQNKDMAHEQMQFQNNMSSTAHQREVQDLRAAGLNPILSGTGGMGAASAQGASAQFQNVAEPAVDTGWQIAGKQRELASSQQAERQSISQTRLLDASAKKAQAEAKSAEYKSEMDAVDAYNYNRDKFLAATRTTNEIFEIVDRRGWLGAQTANTKQMTATEREKTAKAEVDVRISRIEEQIKANDKIKSDMMAKVDALPYAWKIELIDRITKQGAVGMTAFVASGLIEEIYEAWKKLGSNGGPEVKRLTPKMVEPEPLQAPVAP